MSETANPNDRNTDSPSASDCCPTCNRPLENTKHWSGWVAALHCPGEDDTARYVVAPKAFWEENQCVPDWCMDETPDGFFESQEHTLDSIHSLPAQKKMLESHGFEIVDWPH